MIVCEIILCWASLVSVFHSYLDFDKHQNLGFLYFVIGCPFISFVFLNQYYRQATIILQKTLRQLKNETEFELFMCELMELMRNKDNANKIIQLEGVLLLHSKSCNKVSLGCVCRQLQTDVYIQDSKSRLKQWEQFLKLQLNDGIDKFSKSCRVRLLGAYVNQERMKNKFKALYELMIGMENKPTVLEEFSIFRYQLIIEQEMSEFDQRTNEIKGFDVNQIVKFQNLFVIFQSQIEQSVDVYHEFWKELLEESPDITKLQQLGSRITILNEQTIIQFKKLSTINPNDYKSLVLYGNFLKDVVNEENESVRMIEKAEYIVKSAEANKMALDVDKTKYGENSNTCIITCSGNYYNVGIITNVNKEVTRILGFQQSDLVGQNVSRIMPKIYADLHDGFMRAFLDTSDSKIMGVERLIMAQNKAGYLVPCSLMIKVLPNLNQGIQFVGFLKEIEETQSANQAFINAGKGTSIQSNNSFSESKMFFLLYHPNTYIVMGLTQNCFESFGIPSLLVYGNQMNTQQFTVDLIIPSVVEQSNQENLKNQGIVCGIDTTNLRQEYLIGMNDSDEEEMDHQLVYNYYEQSDIYNKSMDHSNIQLLDQHSLTRKRNSKKIKLDRYRKSSIKVMLVDEFEYKDSHVCLLQFMEATEESKKLLTTTTQQPTRIDPDVQRYDQNGKIGEEQESERPLMENEEHAVQASDRESSGFVVTEDVRLLREFKQLMTEKRETRTMRMLGRTIYSLLITLVIITSVNFAYKLKQYDTVLTGSDAIHSAYLRQNIMGDVLYNCRMLQMVAKGNYTPKSGQTESSLETSFKAKLSSYVTALQATQFSLIKARISMNSESGSKPPTRNYTVKFLLQDATIKIVESQFDDAFIQFLTSASAIRNASMSSFNKTDTVESTKQNFYYVIENGYRVLRSGSEEIAMDFFEFYSSLIDSFTVTFIVTLSIAVFFLVASQLILVPLVFQVHNTNSSVMSLFGLISLEEVKSLAQKCENFKIEYLRDIQQDDSQLKNQEVKQQGEVKNKQVEKEQDPYKSYVEINNEEKQVQPEAVVAKPLGKTIGQLKEEVQQQHDEDEAKKIEEDADNLRSQKLLNTKSSNRVKMVIKFFTTTSIFIAYFAGDFAMEVQFQSDIEHMLSHLQIVSQRPYNMKFTVYISFEQVILQKKITEGGVDLHNQLSSRTNSNERDLFTSLQDSFPASFDNYLRVFDDFNYGNLCKQSFQQDDFKMVESTCKKANNGLLLKGLRTSIVSVILSTNLLLTSTDSMKVVLNSEQQSDLVDVINQASPSLDYLTNQFKAGLRTYLDAQTQIEQIKFSCFIVVLAIVLIFIWLPFNRSLSQQIWRIKGMLNMIPMEVIRKQANLKQAFLSGDIIQAVK